LKEIYATKTYQDEAIKTAVKESELQRLIKVKSEKICNDFLMKHSFTQLSYLTEEEKIGALALPKGIILDKIINYLNSI
jgi:hypothetical protein